MFWTVTVSAQLTVSPELRDALISAAELQNQGKFLEAFNMLVAIKPKVSEYSPLDSLESAYDDDNPLVNIMRNEFYLKDRALRELVDVLLTNRQSGNAVIVAQHIANQPLRTNALVNILMRQCHAAMSHTTDPVLMIGKAEKTVALLTGYDQDLGYSQIAKCYVYADMFDRSLESLKKIQDAAQRDKAVIDVAVQAAYYTPNNKTPDNELLFRSLVDFAQSPMAKAGTLLALADYYRKTPQGINEIDESAKIKRFEALQEAMALLDPLPDDEDKIQQVLLVIKAHETDARKTEAEAIRQIALASVENVTDDVKRFHLYFELFRHDKSDADAILAKMQTLAEQQTIAKQMTDKEYVARGMLHVLSICVEVRIRTLLPMIKDREIQGRLVEAEAMRQTALAFVENVREDFKRAELYLGLLRRDKPDADAILAKIQTIAEQISEPLFQTEIVLSLWESEAGAPNASDDRRKELFDKTLELVLSVGQRGDAGMQFNRMLHQANSEETDTLIAIMLGMLSEPDGSWTDDGVASIDYGSAMVNIVRVLVKQNRVDWMLENIFSPQMPYGWKQFLYQRAAEQVLDLWWVDSELREDDFMKLIDLIETPQIQSDLLHIASLKRFQTN